MVDFNRQMFLKSCERKIRHSREQTTLEREGSRKSGTRRGEVAIHENRNSRPYSTEEEQVD
jgi:hypothetical protein